MRGQRRPDEGRCAVRGPGNHRQSLPPSSDGRLSLAGLHHLDNPGLLTPRTSIQAGHAVRSQSPAPRKTPAHPPVRPPGESLETSAEDVFRSSGPDSAPSVMNWSRRNGTIGPRLQHRANVDVAHRKFICAPRLRSSVDVRQEALVCGRACRCATLYCRSACQCVSAARLLADAGLDHREPRGRCCVVYPRLGGWRRRG